VPAEEVAVAVHERLQNLGNHEMLKLDETVKLTQKDYVPTTSALGRQ
jgi:hypothetical protein